MWKKGEKIRVDGVKVYVDHVFEDGSASIREVRTGLLKGKIAAKTPTPPTITVNKETLNPSSTETYNLYQNGLSVQDFNRLIEAQESYENMTEKYYSLLEEGSKEAKAAENDMIESLNNLKTIEKQIFQ